MLPDEMQAAGPEDLTHADLLRAGRCDGDGQICVVQTRDRQNQRIQALKGFQDGYYRVLVATDVAARFGGDEFAVLLYGVGTAVDAARVAERILRTLGEPMPIAGRQLRVEIRLQDQAG